MDPYQVTVAEAAGVDTSRIRPRCDASTGGGRAARTSNDGGRILAIRTRRSGRTKRGTTRIIYKPEHVLDLEPGAIVDADVGPGDAHDTEDLADRVLGDPKATERVESVAADTGYFQLADRELLQGVGI